MFYKVYFEDVKTGLFDFDKAPAIFIRVEDDPDRFFVPSNAPIVLWLAEDCKVLLEKIACDLNGKFFGAGNFLEIVEKSPNDFLLKAELPRMYYVSLEICSICDGIGTIKKDICLNCNGSGKTNKVCSRCFGAGCDEIYDHECFECGGRDIEIRTDWTNANELLANLQFLFRLLNSRLIDTEIRQEIEYAPLISKIPYSVNIGATFYIPIVDWLAGLEGKDIALVKNLMEKIYSFMWCDKHNAVDVEVEIKNQEGAFYLICPGDRCCVYANRTFDFNSHNIDNPAQVLTLWAGLSELERLRGQ